MDRLTVDSLKFMTTISHDLYCRTDQCIAEAKSANFEECLTQIYRVYKKAGLIIIEIHYGNEFNKAMNNFAAAQDPIIIMNYANTKEHVPRAERNNRTIRERVRASYYQMPYKHLPRILVKYMVSEAARKLNYFPAKHGISKYYSPRMIVHKENIDYDKHCKFVLGEYVQAHDKPLIKNTNAPRSLDCIYLRPTVSHQG